LAVDQQRIVPAIEDVFHDLGGEEVQAVAAAYAGAAGIDAINAYFHALNRNKGRRCLHGFAEDDPCIWTVNDYDRRLWNGSMGRVVGFDGEAIVVEIDGSRHVVTADEIDRIELAYCISVHKAQGSQFKNVVMPIVATANLDRSMLYTGVTRAIERVVLVGSRGDFEGALLPHPRSLDRDVALRPQRRAAVEMETD
jgi:exodeoxyribonuclease V alpha subunit